MRFLKEHEYIHTLAFIAVGVLCAMGVRRFGLAQKWEVAFVIFLCPYVYVPALFRSYWSRASFWVSLTACAALHLLAIWFIFVHVMKGVVHISVFWAIPIAVVETIPLVFLIGRFEQTITRHGGAR